MQTLQTTPGPDDTRLTLSMQVIVIGGGISGIATAIRLREALGNKVNVTVSGLSHVHTFEHTFLGEKF